MFKSVSSKLDAPLLEENILKMWKKQDIFKKTVEQRKDGPNYVFMKDRQLPMGGQACIMF